MSPLFEQFSRDFLGLDAPGLVVLPDGTTRPVRRIYLDSAATCLMPRPTWAAAEEYLRTSCANSHTHSATPGISTTLALQRVHDLAGQLVGRDKERDCVIMTGSGATAAVNLLAQALMRDKARPIAVVSGQEHHSNILPWIRHAGAENVIFAPALPDGRIDTAALAKILSDNKGRVRVLAVTALSNVTGVINPVNELARMAHAAGAEIAVDAAQAGAHVPVAMHPKGSPGSDLDYVALSGHKLYAPGSPGVLVGNKQIFENCGWTVGQVGGGTVEYVGTDSVRFKADASERQEAGTPNIPGAVMLGVSLGILQKIGIGAVREHEKALVARAIERLTAIPGLVVYGPADPEKRAAVVTFNLGSAHHGLVAAALNDYFAVTVRNDCFCAQPYVRSQIFAACDVRGFCDAAMLKHRGMVRASFGVYSTEADVDALAAALAWIAQHVEWLKGQYTDDGSGNYTHRMFRQPMPFSIDAAVDRYAGSTQSGQGLLKPAGQAVQPAPAAALGLAAFVTLAAGAALWYGSQRRTR